MVAGTVVADRNSRLFVVLESNRLQQAVAPLRIGRVRGDKTYAGDVAISLARWPNTIVRCGSAHVIERKMDQSGEQPFSSTGLTISPEDLARCQRAARIVAEERELSHLFERNDYTNTAPWFRSGGRRVGSSVGP